MAKPRLWSSAAVTLCCAVVSAFALCSAWGLSAQVPPIVLEPVVANLSEPVLLTHSRDGTQRRFIVEQSGRILVLQPGAPTPSVFLDIRDRVLAGGERGLLGLAFHPQYASNRRFFVNYTRRPDGATVIAEFRTPALDAQLADPAFELVLLVIDQPFANHNGGMIEFGHDNFLYIATGDGGSANDPQNRAQNRDELLGKILRIDVDRASAPALYVSPPANPFFGRVHGRDEIYAYGFRNPWRFSFDRLTGDLYAGDVGQNAREEIDIVVRGGNYGWRVFEGTRCTTLGPASCGAGALFHPPITEYENGSVGCSVTGGYVYRGSRQSLPYGAYVFGDYCTGEIFMFHHGARTLLLDTALNIASFGEDEEGEIYVVGHRGSIHRIANPNAVQSSQFSFQIPGHNATVLRSLGAGAGLTTGYGRVEAPAGTFPSGTAHLHLRRGGVVVSEASFPASPLLQSARVFATIAPQRASAVAIVNPNSRDVQIEFYFTRASGERLGGGVATIPGGGKVSAFLNESPFNGPADFTGSLTFRAIGGTVSAMALIGRTNERSDFLMAALPVVDLDFVPRFPGTFPYWVHGGEWNTEFVLMNASTQLSAGVIHMVSTSGRIVGTLPYTLDPEASRVFRPQLPGSIRFGSARITPSVGPSPQGVAVFRQTLNGVTVMESGISVSTPGLVFESHAEMSVDVQTGLALVNAWPAPVVATISLSRLDGTSAGRATLSLPSLGQQTIFLDELGLVSVTPFEGIVRVTAPTPVVAANLRRRTNERGELLLSASTPANRVPGSSGPQVFFAHWVLGDGYETQFILTNPAGGPVFGTLHFFSDSGRPLPLLLP